MIRKPILEQLEARTLLAIDILYSASDTEHVAIATGIPQEYSAKAEISADVGPRLNWPGDEENYFVYADLSAYIIHSGPITGSITVTTTMYGVSLAAESHISASGHLRYLEARATLVITGYGDVEVHAGWTANTEKDRDFSCCGDYVSHENYFAGTTGQFSVVAHGSFQITITAHTHYLETDTLQMATPAGQAYDTMYADHANASMELDARAPRYSVVAYGRTRVYLDQIWGSPTELAEAHKFAYGELNLPSLNGRGAFSAKLMSDSARYLGGGTNPWGRTNEYTATAAISLGRAGRGVEGNIATEVQYNDQGTRRDVNLRRTRNGSPELEQSACGYCQGDQAINEEVFSNIENWLLPLLLTL